MAGRDLFEGAPPDWLNSLAEEFVEIADPVFKPIYDWSLSRRPSEDAARAREGFTAIGDFIIPEASANGEIEE